MASSFDAAAGTPDCAGKVTLTASASGGAGGFTYQWFDGATPIGTGSPLTVTLTPGDHSITVKATDSSAHTHEVKGIRIYDEGYGIIDVFVDFAKPVEAGA